MNKPVDRLSAPLAFAGGAVMVAGLVANLILWVLAAIVLLLASLWAGRRYRKRLIAYLRVVCCLLVMTCSGCEAHIGSPPKKPEPGEHSVWVRQLQREVADVKTRLDVLERNPHEPTQVLPEPCEELPEPKGAVRPCDFIFVP